jgi:hypothetical protein
VAHIESLAARVEPQRLRREAIEETAKFFTALEMQMGQKNSFRNAPTLAACRREHSIEQGSCRLLIKQSEAGHL